MDWDNLLVSANVVIPLFLLLLLGYLLRRSGFLKEQTVKNMNSVTFRVFLPVMLFVNIYNSSINKDFDGQLILMCIGMSLVSASLTYIIARFVERTDRPRRASLAQGMFRNNYLLYGLPIATTLYGDRATGLMSMLLACIIPVNNVLAVIEISVTVGGGEGSGRVKKTILNVVKNPFVIASAVGFLFLLTGLRFPSPIETAVKNVGSIANPLSLILLGAALRFEKIGDYVKSVVVGIIGKLFLVPLLAVVVFASMGIRDERLLVLFIASATPAAAGSPIMAGEMGADADLANYLVVFETAFSIVSLFIWVYILKSMALI